VEQRLDETEIGAAKFVTLTEVQATSSEAGPVTAATLSDRLLIGCDHGDLTDYDVFASIYNEGKLALLASWRDRHSAERFEPPFFNDVRTIRHRVVRVVRDYGMFERRESSQYYPPVQIKAAPRHRNS
jgi:hypothetical protein